MAKSRARTYGPGGYRPDLPNNNLLSDELEDSPGLSATPSKAAPGEVIFCHYLTLGFEEQVRWLINGIEVIEELEDAVSSIEVVMPESGPLEVICNDEVVFVEEA